MKTIEQIVSNEMAIGPLSSLRVRLIESFSDYCLKQNTIIEMAINTLEDYRGIAGNSSKDSTTKYSSADETLEKIQKLRGL